jgi:hypothetical protein
LYVVALNCSVGVIVFLVVVECRHGELSVEGEMGDNCGLESASFIRRYIYRKLERSDMIEWDLYTGYQRLSTSKEHTYGGLGFLRRN